MVDHNNLQGFGLTSEVASMSPLWEKLQGFNIDLHVIDGHSPEEIRNALGASRNRLQVIILRTIKGHGVSYMENKMEWHYLPMTELQFKTAVEDVSIE